MTAAAYKALPRVECKPWCEDNDGHPNQGFKADQACWAPSQYIDLSLEPATREGVDWFPQRLGVMARQRPDEAGHIYLHLDGIKLHASCIPWPYNYLDHGLQLTTDEALRFAEAIIANVRLATGEIRQSDGT